MYIILKKKIIKKVFGFAGRPDNPRNQPGPDPKIIKLAGWWVGKSRLHNPNPVFSGRFQVGFRVGSTIDNPTSHCPKRQ